MRRLLLIFYALAATAQNPVFTSDTVLQSLAVQVTDKQGNAVKGLTAADFTLLEDGKPQNIAFFATEKQPASVAVLVDASASMNIGGKLIRAAALLAPLLRARRPDDEIFLVPFTDRLRAPFTALSLEQRQHPPVIRAASGKGAAGNGTSFYDSLASTLCHMRAAHNVRQAVVVITDGADQNSRLNLSQLIQLTRGSNAQIFTIGFFDSSEYAIYRESAKTVTLVGEREIDNPVVVFDRLAKESGAESFFPSSEHGLQQAVDRIGSVLDAEYTLAWYPHDSTRFRKIDVKVKRAGVKVLARHGAGADSGETPVRFESSTCEVSAQDHLYPWETHANRDPSGALTWRDDFADPRSGWPNRKEQLPAPRTSFRERDPGGEKVWRPGLRYIPGGYELSRSSVAGLGGLGAIADGIVAAQGPFWDHFRASVRVEGTLGNADVTNPTAQGLVFHLGAGGFYAVLVSGSSVKLVKRTLGSTAETMLIPWKKLETEKQRKLTVEYKRGKIDIAVDDRALGSVRDDEYPSGLIGLGLFGHGRAVFHDLLVEDHPK